jgi:RHS repeat-associated protein
VTVKGVNGENVTTQIVWGSRWVYRQYQAIANNPDETVPAGIERNALVNESIQTVEQIILPSQAGGQSYSLDYYGDSTQPSGTNFTQGWGTLKSVTLPSNAKATYTYQLSNGAYGNSATDVLADQVTERSMTFADLYDGVATLRTETTSYYSFQGSSTVSNPDGSGVSEQAIYYTGGPSWDSGLPYRNLTSGGVKTEKIWKQNLPYYSNNPYPYQYLVPGNGNAYVKTEFSTISDATGQPSLTAIKDFNHDKNGNVTRITEYEWVGYATVPRQNDRPTGIPTNAVVKRITVNEYYNQTPDADSTNSNPYSYENPSSPKLKNVIKSTEIQNANLTPISRTEFYYDDPDNKGNVTETRVWDSTKGAVSAPLTTGSNGNSISTTAVYDPYGNPTFMTDAKGTQTQITYGSINGYSGLYPTQTISAYQTPIARTSTAAYDFNTGLVTTATDVDNNVSVVTEYDALGRPTKVRSAANTALESWTRTEYNDVARRVIVRSDLETIGDGKKVAVQHYDQLGRVRLSRSIENIASEDPYNEQHGIKVETRYQTGNPNSYQLTSNPFRAATATTATIEPSMGWTRSKSWNTGRKQQVETFTGAALPAPWGTNANSTGIVTTDIDADRTLVTDQAGKQRISRTNALGQLKDIWEVTPSDASTVAVTFPNTSIATGYKTSYNYDTLNNLTTVNQGAQTRSFSYSSLSRLLSANNPESGLISYGYDPNGNLTQKTDARLVVTNYIYDALNRVTNRNYTAPGGLANYQATPNVSYFYDNLPNAKGRLIKVTNGTGVDRSTTEYVTFDILGRVTRSKQTTDGVIYGTDAAPMTYTYNLSGAMIEQQYPSGRVVKNTLDNDGDLMQVQSRRANDNFRNYANGFTYTAAGAVSSMRLGNGKFENTQFNSRLQPTQIGLGSSASTQNLLKLNYDYGAADNNGNVKNQTITVNRTNLSPLVFNQTYVYDSLNRLKSAEDITGTTSNWKQTFSFDRYGNRSFDQANTSQPASFAAPNITNPTMDVANNRFTTGQGYTYDLVGNVVSDAEGRTFTYDAENKQKEAKNSSNATLGTYYFDGDGKRVKKISAPETTIFVYDAGGKLVAEYSTNLSSTPQLQYLTSDNLGTPRINTDANGQILSRTDYMPYGEEIIGLGGRSSADKYVADDVRQGFTGYINDGETGLDFAQARMFAPKLGRFTGADPLLSSGRLHIPQSWNRYSYVLGNPVKFADPTGLFEWDETLQDRSTDSADERARRKNYRAKIVASIEGARQKAKAAFDAGKLSQKKFDKINNALNAYGKENEANGVTVGTKTSLINNGGSRGETLTALEIQSYSPTTTVKGLSKVSFDISAILSEDIETTIVHEGQHVADNNMMADIFNNFLSGMKYQDQYKDSRVISQYQTESNAFTTQSYFYEALGQNDGKWGTWNKGWAKKDEADQKAKVQSAVDKIILKGYGVSSVSPGPNMLQSQCSKPCKF